MGSWPPGFSSPPPSGGPQATVTITSNQGLILTGQTGGGVGAAPTIVAGPVAGDPAIWCPIRVNGSLRYFPCW